MKYYTRLNQSFLSNIIVSYIESEMRANHLQAIWVRENLEEIPMKVYFTQSRFLDRDPHHDAV